MTPYEITAQIISIIAMGCTIISYQYKAQKNLVICHLLGGLFFAVSFFMLDAIIGGILNIFAMIRSIIFLFPKKLKANHPAWLWGFIASYIVFYVLTFTVFDVEPTLVAFVIEILPIIGMTALSVGFMFENTKAVRLTGLISSPAWLIYNIYYVSSGAIICEAISIISIIIGMIRHDKKESTNQTNQIP